MGDASERAPASVQRTTWLAAPTVRQASPESYRIARGALLALLVNGATGALLFRAYAPGKPTIVFLAALLAALVTLSLHMTWRYPGRRAPWIVLAVSLLASRQMLFLGTGRLFGVRDSSVHVLGLPLDIVTTGHIPEGATYSTYPVIHLLLSIAHFATGMDLWDVAPLLATLLAGATAVFVVLLARDFLPGSQAVALIVFLGMMNAIPPGQLYQPMSVTILLFGALLYLLPRRPGFHLSVVLFLGAALVLAMTHAYSSATLTLAIFLTCVVDALVSGRRQHLVPAGLALAYSFTYSAVVGGDLDYFLSLFEYSAFNPATELAFGQPVPPSQAPPLNVPYRVVNNLALVIPFLLAIVGWIWMLKERRFRPATLQWTAVALGLLYFVGALFPFFLPSRTLTLSAVLVAPFAAYALSRLPRPAVLAVVPVLVVVALTSTLAVNHYFPWSDRNLVVHPVENDPAASSAIHLFGSLDPQPGRFDVVASHEVFHDDRVLPSQGFTTMNVPGDPHADYFVFRTDSPEAGYSKISYESRGSQARFAFTPFPTDEQLALLSASDRIAHLGDFQVYRA